MVTGFGLAAVGLAVVPGALATDAAAPRLSREQMGALTSSPAFRRATTAEGQRARDRSAQLATPGETSRRRGSRTALRHLSDAQAIDVAAGTPGLPAPASQTALPLAAGQRLEHYLGDYAAKIDVGGGHSQLLMSTRPLLTRGADGVKHPTDYRLAHRGTVIEPVNPLTAFMIHDQLAQGIDLGSTGVRVAPVSAKQASPPKVDGARAIFANSATDTDTVAAPTPDGMATDSVLRSQDSSPNQDWQLTLPAGARLQMVDATKEPASAGAAEVVRNGRRLVVISRPTASDADGAAVPVSMSVQGTTLHISADLSGDIHFPVAIDPNYSWSGGSWPGWWGGIYNPPDPGAYGVFTPGTCWSWGCGLYADVFVGHYVQAYGNAAYYWYSPYGTFISDAWWGNIDALVPGYEQWNASAYWPYWYQYDGIEHNGQWKTTPNPAYPGTGSPELVTGPQNGNWHYRSSTPNSDANPDAVSFGFSPDVNGGSDSGVYYVGAVSATIGDTNPPQVTSVTPPAGWVSGTGNITATLSDVGLGPNQLWVNTPNTSGGTDTTPSPGNSCSYTYTSTPPCPGPFTQTWPFSTANMPEGANQAITVSGNDYAGNLAPSVQASVNVDRTPPRVAASGPLRDLHDKSLPGQAFDLTVSGNDPAPSSGGVQSGIASIDVYVTDLSTGQRTHPFTQSCNGAITCSSDNSDAGGYALESKDFPQGDTLRIDATVTDGAGNPATDSWQVTNGSQPESDCSGAGQQYTQFAVAPPFDGLPFFKAQRTCTPAHDGQPRWDVTTYVYGTCDTTAGSCQPPLQIQVSPLCESHASLYTTAEDQPYPFQSTTIDGVPAAIFDAGNGTGEPGSAVTELYTGTTTIAIYGADAGQELRVAEALAPVPLPDIPALNIDLQQLLSVIGAPVGNLPLPDLATLASPVPC